MTTDYLKFEHPEVYNEIFNLGVEKERKRTENWLVHLDINKDEVLKGIRSGAELNNTESEEMALANSIKKHLSQQI